MALGVSLLGASLRILKTLKIVCLDIPAGVLTYRILLIDHCLHRGKLLAFMFTLNLVQSSTLTVDSLGFSR